MNCPKCGVSIEEKDEFCPGCGEYIKQHIDHEIFKAKTAKPTDKEVEPTDEEVELTDKEIAVRIPTWLGWLLIAVVLVVWRPKGIIMWLLIAVAIVVWRSWMAKGFLRWLLIAVAILGVLLIIIFILGALNVAYYH